MAKKKAKELDEDLIHKDDTLIPDDKDEADFSDENIFEIKPALPAKGR